MRLPLQIILFLMITCVFFETSYGQSVKSGTGCYLDTSTGQKVFTKKLGTQKWYDAKYDVYSNTIDVYKVVWGNPKCNEAMVSGSFGSCWVNSQVNSADNSNGAQWGTLVNYTVTTCAPMNVPLDDHIWILMLGATALTSFYLARNKIAFA